MSRKLVVLKLGGSCLKGIEDFELAVDWIVKRRQMFQDVVVVVSAMEAWTNQLISLGQSIHPNPPKREMDMLISCGERISMSLLTMALDKRGIESVSLTGSQAGIVTSSDHANASVVEVRPKKVYHYLSCGKVVVIAGFQGVSVDGEITTLGRGGSDTTAVVLGQALNAAYVEFFKDVPGICLLDPKKDGKNTPYLKAVSFDQVEEILHRTGKFLHEPALRFAKEHHLSLHFLQFGQLDEVVNQGTWVLDNENQVIAR